MMPKVDPCATSTAPTRSSATIITPPPATSIRKDTIRCFQKLRFRSTPHASLTALVIAPNTPGDAKLNAGPVHRVELFGDEIELGGEIAEDEGQNSDAIFLVVGNRTEQRKHQEQKRKEREEGVIRNRGGVREVVAVDHLDDAAPGGHARESKLRPQAP